MADRALPITSARYRSYKDDGTVNSGGKIYFYEAGTTTPKDTYQDAEATTANANPVVLDTRGEAVIFGKGAYKIIETDSNDVQIGDAEDGILLPTITDDALGLLNDASFSAMRTTLGLGTAATKNAGTSAGNVLLLEDNDKLPALNGENLTNIAAGAAPLPYGYLSGFQLSRNTTAILNIGAGACRDKNNAANMSLSTAYTKTVASWAEGTGNGALDSGALAISTWYHVHIIYNPTSGTTDVLFSTSATSPTLPAGYTRSRRVGSFLTDGSNYITEFSQNGDEFLWLDPPLDISKAGVDITSASNETLTTPSGVKTRAILNLTAKNSTAAFIYISSPDVNDEAPPAAGATAPLGVIGGDDADKWSVGRVVVRTNTSSQVRVRSSQTNQYLYAATVGWYDDRGK